MTKNLESPGKQEVFSDAVKQEFAKHLKLYQTNPEAAHIWDPIVIGVPGGPVKNLMLTHTGRTTGKKLQTVLQYYESDGKTVIIASSGGAADHPSWYLNLLANPSCHVQIGKFGTGATARTLEGEERTNWRRLIIAEQPQQASYEQRTSRTIPIVVLDFA